MKVYQKCLENDCVAVKKLFILKSIGFLMMLGVSKMVAKMSERYSKNPFVTGMIIPVKGKRIRLSKLGKDDNVLVNQLTGEEQGTHVTTYKKVDSEQFVKLFAQNIALTFDLKSAGIKAFNLMLWCVQNAIEKDQIPLDKYALSIFLKENNDRKPRIQFAISTLSRGLRELEQAQIIAKTIRPGWFYINPNFCFNGDRIAFSSVIERRNPTKDKTLDWIEEAQKQEEEEETKN